MATCARYLMTMMVVAFALLQMLQLTGCTRLPTASIPLQGHSQHQPLPSALIAMKALKRKWVIAGAIGTRKLYPAGGQIMSQTLNTKPVFHQLDKNPPSPPSTNPDSPGCPC